MVPAAEIQRQIQWDDLLDQDITASSHPGKVPGILEGKGGYNTRRGNQTVHVLPGIPNVSSCMKTVFYKTGQDRGPEDCVDVWHPEPQDRGPEDCVGVWQPEP